MYKVIIYMRSERLIFYNFMDIEKVFNRNKVFRNNLGTFDLQLCRWKGITTNYSTKK